MYAKYIRTSNPADAFSAKTALLFDIDTLLSP
ncbi:hypothetical protein LTSEADE_4894, partial [Salmonella enterica subsp. enterica serovar Adelaide str. A4-669]